MKLINVCGARPNFIKIAPLMEAYQQYPDIQAIIVHTGQHYDDNMSTSFFDDLAIPRPDINLRVGSASHAEQTAEIMKRFEPVVTSERPDAVVVVGDVNSTMACSLVACKMGIAVIHVEAGLRSFDRSMPEEINRMVTDAVADLLFVTEPSGEVNLRGEGIPLERIHYVGNVMIDTLLKHREKARASKILGDLGIEEGAFGVITLHRPSNVDSPSSLGAIAAAFDHIQQSVPLVFCIHPRTREKIAESGLQDRFDAMQRLVMTPPLGYLDFLHLISCAGVIFTDSGGIQEEATILKVPCLTIRSNTERPITLTHGTNFLAGTTTQSILSAYECIAEIRERKSQTPPLWDGQAAQRIAATLNNLLC